MFRNKGIIIFFFLVIAGGIIFYIVKRNQSKTLYETKIAAVQADSKFLLTVILKHDQSKTLDELQKKLAETGFYKNFPPDGVKIESWKVVMGIGQVITLEVPANKLRDVNIAIEKMAWGPFRSEFYPTYDFLPIYKSFRDTTVKDSTNKIGE
jgi:hypothetical protein